MDREGDETSKTCPECQAIMPINSEFVTWCDQCNWNVKPLELEPPKSFVESLYQRLGKRSGQVLFEKLTQKEALKPTPTVSKVIAFVIASIIHSMTLIIAIGGVALLIGGWPNIFAIMGGLLLLAMAWTLRPRIPKLNEKILSADKFPHLYQFVESVVNQLNAQSVYGIIIDSQLNASVKRYGWRQQTILRLGLPLWTILDVPERVALVAHELAHSINGDTRRSVWVGTAIDTLGGWYQIIVPSAIWRPDMGIMAIIILPINLALYGIAQLVLAIAIFLIHLLWSDSQRAEYLADHLAANISGSQAAIGLLEKMYLATTFETTTRQVALRQKYSELNFFEVLRHRFANVPEREFERIRRVQLLEGSRLNVTHPPTAYRVKLLQMHTIPASLESFEADSLAAIDEELAILEGGIHQKIVDHYRARIYR